VSDEFYNCGKNLTKEEQDGFKMKIFIPKRNPASHKGSYGKCLIIAGAEGMAGAAYFASLSAYRTGTGLVKLCSAKENLGILQTLIPEAIMLSAPKIKENFQELEKTIESKERKVSMPTKEKFKGFSYQDNQKYKQAAIDLYGREVIEEAIQKQKGKEQEITDGFNRIFFAFSENKSNGLSATAQENIQLAEELHKHLCRYAFDCPMDVFSSIAYGYVQNKEFKNNLDQFGDGTAQYVCDAVQQYVKEQ